MKIIATVSLTAALFSGCAFRPPAASSTIQLSAKRVEIDVLQEELVVAIRSLDRLQRELARRGTSRTQKDYSLEAQERDLNYFARILRQALDRLAAEDRRLHHQYGVGYGPI